MREILFRAKTEPNTKTSMTGKIIKKPKWIYGYIDLGYMHDCKTPLISDEKGNNVYKCQLETIGQYTGLTDKNGKKIFEGDIVKVYEDIDYRIGVHKFNRKTRTIIGVVVFDEKRFEYQIKNEEYNLTLFRLSKKDTNEVIGNIHDNPELLKGGEG